MRRVGFLLVIVGLMACVPFAAASGREKIKVQCQIYRFTSSVSVSTSADRKIWTTDEPPEDFDGVVTVFNKGRFGFGENKLQLGKEGFLWNGCEIPIDEPEDVNLPGQYIELIYSPTIIMNDRSKSTVKINSKQPLQYFQVRDDGLFELKEITLSTGLDIEIWATEEKDNRNLIRITDMVMTMRSVERREKVPGLNLPVGKPILGTKRYDFYIRVEPRRDYGILIRPQIGQGGLLIRLQASVLKSDTDTD